MKARAFVERAQRVLDSLDARLEGQTFKPGADAPHAVAIVGTFHRAAGDVERHLERMPLDRFGIVASVRILRRIVRTHAVMVDLRAIFLRNGVRP